MDRRAVLLIAAATGVASSPALAARAQILFAQGQWAAVRYGTQCEAVARPLLPAARRQPESRAGFSFSPAASRVGEFHARLSRVPRRGSSVMLIIGQRPFLLVARGDWAWSRGPAQDFAIIAAARAATSMRIESRDGSGRRFADRYLLAGAPTAIDAAAVACAGKI
ncbi:hypothetical protein [Sphingomonas sp.]|uniref:hypothetical protein n=1 Tax=Sphingomonas sp. TaxID=28214 RepID=UPI00182C243C|nr:hypothetical protein [Sphingomonas sp.]MBA3511091.1 hypothetical protein [Sphingomonas sp.]